MLSVRLVRLVILSCAVLSHALLFGQNVRIQDLRSTEGYLFKLLVNEVAFPGEHGYISEQDTMRAMESILLVLDARIHYIPSPYTRQQVAQTSSEKLLDIITAGGLHGQVDGFYHDVHGVPVCVARVDERVEYLVQIANQGRPGRFTRLLNYSASLSRSYIARLERPENMYAHLRWVAQTPVTGRAYSWMADHHYYHS